MKSNSRGRDYPLKTAKTHNFNGFFENRFAKEILEDNLATVKIIKVFSEGRSGAKVCLIDISGEKANPDDLRGKYILKIDNCCDEQEKYYELSFMTNSFCKKHILPLAYPSKVVNSQYFLIMPVAGYNMHLYEEAYKLTPAKIRSAFQNISKKILYDLNGMYRIEDDSKVSNMLEDLLGSKLQKNKPLYNFLGKLNNKLLSESTFNIYEHILPNPFYYASLDFQWHDMIIRRIKGLSHGDLHGLNIFVNKEKLEDFFLIDISDLNKNGYVFFDNAYLETSYLLDHSESISLNQWFSLINGILARSEEHLEGYNLDLYELAMGIQQEKKEYIEKKIGGNANIAVLQATFMRFISGLNFAGKKGLNDDKRQKALLYAAVFLKKYFELIEKKIESDSFNFFKNQFDNQEEVQNLAEFVEYFDDSQSNFILISGDIPPTFDEGYAEVLSNIPWKLILDCCKMSLSNSFLKYFKELMSEKFKTAQLHIGNEESLKTLNFEASSLWFYTQGIVEYSETVTNSASDWRRRYGKKTLVPIFEKLTSYIEYKEACFVIDAKSFGNIESSRYYIEKIVEYIDDIFEENARIAILNDESSITYKEYCESLQKFDCTLEGLASIARNYVPIRKKSSITLRNPSGEFVSINEIDINRFDASFDLITGNLALQNADPEKPFFRGYNVSWQEISNGIPVDRNKPIHWMVDSIKDNINERRYGFVTLNHQPGTGASTILKLVAWHVKEQYPTLFLKNLSNSSILDIQKLYQKMDCHIIIFIDLGVSQDDVIQFSRQLESYSIKHVIVTAFHDYTEKTTANIAKEKNSYWLSKIDEHEKEYFQQCYTQRIHEIVGLEEEKKEARINQINVLTTHQVHVRYRVPYFYGLIAFEKDFHGLDKYLTAVFQGIDRDSKLEKAFKMISFITCYGDASGIPFKEIAKLFDMKTANQRKLSAVLNISNYPVVILKENAFHIAHITISEDILTHTKIKPRTVLFYEQCKQFIHFVHSFKCDETLKLKICKEVFLKRTGTYEEGKDQFARCVEDIKSSEHKLDIFKLLTELFPEDPHFYAHYGRAIIELFNSNITDARTNIRIALRKAKKNQKAEFYHMLGMVYYRHMHHCFNVASRKKMKFVEFWNSTSFCVEEAEKSFMDAAERDEEGKTIYMAYSMFIYTVTHFIRELNKRARANGEIFDIYKKNQKISEWCLNKLSMARSIYINIENDSRYTHDKKKTLESYLAWSGNDINKLNKIADDNNNPSRFFARRIINGCTLSDYKSDWSKIPFPKLNRMLGNAYNNILDGEYRNMDMRMFFMSSILSSKHDLDTITTVIENIEPDFVDAQEHAFYMYTLYFAKYYATHEHRCKELFNEYLLKSQNYGKHSIRYKYSFFFLGNNSKFVIASGKFDMEDSINSEEYENVLGRVYNIHEDRMQSGQLALGMDTDIKAFFVPSKAKPQLNADDHRNADVHFIIGFSYSGLRAWEVKLKQ